MPTEPELLDAIRQAPNADGPVLAYAKWLNAQGDPLGAYIDAHFAPPEVQSTLNFDAMGEALEATGRLPSASTLGVQEVNGRRGVPQYVSAKARTVIDRAEDILKAVPLLSELRLTDAAGLGRELAQLPLLSSIRMLTFGKGVGDAEFAAIIQSPHLTSLRDLRQGTLQLAGIEALAKSPACARLESLHLTRSTVGDDGAAALARAGSMPSLRTLYLTKTGISHVGVGHLAASTVLANVQVLSLADNPKVGPSGMAAIARSAYSTNIQELLLQGAEIGDGGMEAIATSPHLTSLTKLYLGDPSITSSGVKLLVQSPAASRLRVLTLSNCAIEDEAIEAIAVSPNLDSLEELSLQSMEILGLPQWDEVYPILIKSKHLKSLRELAVMPVEDAKILKQLEKRFPKVIASYN